MGNLHVVTPRLSLCPLPSSPQAALKSSSGNQSPWFEGRRAAKGFGDRLVMHGTKKTFQLCSPPVPHPAERICSGDLPLFLPSLFCPQKSCPPFSSCPFPGSA